MGYLDQLLQRPPDTDGIDYTSVGVRALRADLITTRGEMLAEMAFERAVMLTHAIALLDYLADVVAAAGK